MTKAERLAKLINIPVDEIVFGDYSPSFAEYVSTTTTAIFSIYIALFISSFS